MLKDKLEGVRVNPSFTAWITLQITDDHNLSDWGAVSVGWRCAAGGSTGDCSSSFPVHIVHSTDFKYNFKPCHIQKYSDDTAIVFVLETDRKGSTRT